MLMIQITTKKDFNGCYYIGKINLSNNGYFKQYVEFWGEEDGCIDQITQKFSNYSKALINLNEIMKYIERKNEECGERGEYMSLADLISDGLVSIKRM